MIGRDDVLLLVDHLLPAWPGGGYICRACEAWAKRRQDIVHHGSCRKGLADVLARLADASESIV